MEAMTVLTGRHCQGSFFSIYGKCVRSADAHTRCVGRGSGCALLRYFKLPFLTFPVAVGAFYTVLDLIQARADHHPYYSYKGIVHAHSPR
jgi:hypothetical protein